MTTALAHTVKIAVMIESDTAQVAEWVNALTVLIGALLALAGWLKPALLFAADFTEAANFTAKIMAIGFNALAFGLGVRI